MGLFLLYVNYELKAAQDPVFKAKEMPHIHFNIGYTVARCRATLHDFHQELIGKAR